MKRTLSLLSFSALFLLLVVNSCTKDKGTVVSVNAAADTSIKYQTHIVPILQTYCYGTGSQACHVTNTNQGANGDFTNYQGLKDKVNNGTIASRVFATNGGMPPSYSTGPQVLTASDMQKFQAWVNAGALNN